MTVDAEFDHLVRQHLSDFSTVKLIFPYFHTALFGRKLLCIPAHLRNGELCSSHWGQSIYINYLESCGRDLSIFSYLFIIQLFISVWTPGYLFYTLSYNQILLYLFCCSNCSNFGHWFPVCSCVHFDIHPLMCFVLFF